MRFIDSLQIEKNHIAREMFVQTADDNYLIARWCYIEQLHVDFFWMGAHALEKYMKALLLVNGRPATEFSHNLCKLYERCKEIGTELLEFEFVRPEWMNRIWRPDSAEKFLARIGHWGDPNNRYNMLGHQREPEELFKLDQLVYRIRRLCQTLDCYAVSEDMPVDPRPTYRDLLTRNPQDWSLSRATPLEKAIAGQRGPAVQRAALHMNEMFTSDSYEHDNTVRLSFSMQMPVLLRSVIKPLSQTASAEARADAVRVAEWVLASITLPKSLKKQIRQLIDNPPTDTG